mgnify:CR=1 FL=1
MIERMELQNSLKVVRAEKDLTQQQVADMIGVTRQTISSIEWGQYIPSSKLALVLAQVLHKDFEELFYLREVKDNE